VAFRRHLWYISETLVGLAFFDDCIGVEEKKQMVQNLEEKQGEPHPSPKANTNIVENMALSSFVTTTTKRFFKLLQLPVSFLSQSVNTWNTNEDYQEALQNRQKHQGGE
jgi:hypothetical protein